MNTTGAAPALKDPAAKTELNYLNVLYIALEVFGAYALARLAAPWLAGIIKHQLLPLSGRSIEGTTFEFLFSHLFALCFLPALVIGLVNGNFRDRSAALVWIFPAAVLLYKLLTFSESGSVLEQGRTWNALRYYFGAGFYIPEVPHWEGLSSFSAGARRGLMQMWHTAPFYAGLGYSLGVWISIKTGLVPKMDDAIRRWQKERFEQKLG